MKEVVLCIKVFTIKIKFSYFCCYAEVESLSCVMLNEDVILQTQTVKWTSIFQSKQEKILPCYSWL
jgi:hypothetical protein